MFRFITTNLRPLAARQARACQLGARAPHLQVAPSCRMSQDSTDKQERELVRRPEAGEDIPEQEFVVSKFNHVELVPERPITSLNIEKRISKVKKTGSFSVDIFTGRYDADFLTYPDPLDNREENKLLKDQAQMVKQLWPQIWDDPRQLQKFNFYNLFQLSATEMMMIFEAIGASSRKCYENPLPTTALSSENPVSPQTQVVQSIISLIIRNCMTYWPMYKSDNYKMKELLPGKHIFFGGSEDEKKLAPPIGFCWTEQVTNLGSLPPQEWLTYGLHGGADVGHYLLSGKKTRVLFEEATEHYLIYFRDKFLVDNAEAIKDEDSPNHASDPAVGCCLLHKSELKFSPMYQDSAGFRYTDVEFDLTVSDERIVFPALRRDPKAVNIKALGQLASCSVILGILKDTLRMTYKHLIENKRGLLDCDIIERKLAFVTCKIFAIESMIYYISGMFDGLEDGFDAHLESIIVKIVTNEYAYEVLQELQLICGSDMFIISRLQDQINIFDAFLDGNIHNRLYLSTMGVIWYARSKNMHLNQLRLAPWYPGYLFRHLVRERSEQNNWLTLNADIYGNLHPALKDAAVNLEYVIKRVKYATEGICMQHGKDVTAAQTSLYRLAELSIDAFILTTLCARASKAYCNGSRHAGLDVELTTAFSKELARKVRNYIEEIHIVDLKNFDSRAKLINELNIIEGGYYPESPLDPNV